MSVRKEPPEDLGDQHLTKRAKVLFGAEWDFSASSEDTEMISQAPATGNDEDLPITGTDCDEELGTYDEHGGEESKENEEGQNHVFTSPIANPGSPDFPTNPPQVGFDWWNPNVHGSESEEEEEEEKEEGIAEEDVDWGTHDILNFHDSYHKTWTCRSLELAETRSNYSKVNRKYGLSKPSLGDFLVPIPASLDVYTSLDGVTPLPLPIELKLMIAKTSMRAQGRTVRVIWDTEEKDWTYWCARPANKIPAALHAPFSDQFKKEAAGWFRRAPEVGSGKRFPYFDFSVDTLFFDLQSCGNRLEDFEEYHKAMREAIRAVRRWQYRLIRVRKTNSIKRAPKIRKLRLTHCSLDKRESGYRTGFTWMLLRLKNYRLEEVEIVLHCHNKMLEQGNAPDRGDTKRAMWYVKHHGLDHYGFHVKVFDCDGTLLGETKDKTILPEPKEAAGED